MAAEVSATVVPAGERIRAVEVCSHQPTSAGKGMVNANSYSVGCKIEEGPMSDAFTPVICATRVLGTRVLDESGRRIGVITDLMLDKESNVVLFAVVAKRGFWGLSQMYLPVPWSALRYDLFDRSYKMDASQTELSVSDPALRDHVD